MTKPDFAEIAAYITAENVRDLLIDLVDIPSTTGKEIGVAQYLVERMRKAGMDTDLPLVDENRPNAVGHLARTRRRAQSAVHRPHGHLVFRRRGASGGRRVQAQGVSRDGWVWGLGANNMKSGLASALIAIEAIVKAGIKLAGDISFGGVVGEIEKTAIEEFQGIAYSGYGIGTRHLVTHGVTADFALLAEPTGMRISIANMGCIWLRITVGGTVAHSALANKPNVVNAIAVMHDLQNDIAQWARDYEAAHVYMGEHPNVTLAAIRGGAPWRLSRNPYACSLYLDIRTVPGQTVDGVKREPAACPARLRRPHRYRRTRVACLCQRSAGRARRKSADHPSARRGAGGGHGRKGGRDHPPARRRRRPSHGLWRAVRCIRTRRTNASRRARRLHARVRRACVGRRLRHCGADLPRNGARPLQPQGGMISCVARDVLAEPSQAVLDLMRDT